MSFYVVVAVVVVVVINVIICCCRCWCRFHVDCWILLLALLLSRCSLSFPLFLLLSSTRPCLLPQRDDDGASHPAQGRQQWRWQTRWLVNDNGPTPSLGEEARPLAGCANWWVAGCPFCSCSLEGAETGRGARQPLPWGGVLPPQTRTSAAGGHYQMLFSRAVLVLKFKNFKQK